MEWSWSCFLCGVAGWVAMSLLVLVWVWGEMKNAPLMDVYGNPLEDDDTHG